MLIDCDSCAVRGPACGNCVVAVLLGAPAVPTEAGTGVDLDGAEQAAIAVLAGCGLVPPLRLVPTDDSAGERSPHPPDGAEELPQPLEERHRQGRRRRSAG